MRSGRIEISAASIVVAIGSSRATPLLTRGSAGMLETLSAIALSARGQRQRSRRRLAAADAAPATGAGCGRPRDKP